MQLIYAYYGAPWAMKSGDDVRIHTICKLLSQMDSATAAYNLSQHVDVPTVVRADGATYVALHRKLYRALSRFTRWMRSEGLNHLIELAHCIDKFT
jgi:hypothetical protein